MSSFTVSHFHRSLTIGIETSVMGTVLFGGLALKCQTRVEVDENEKSVRFKLQPFKVLFLQVYSRNSDI